MYYTTKELHKILRCGDFRISTPKIYDAMVSDPCCRKCHGGQHRRFGQRQAKVFTMEGYALKMYTLCCRMNKICIKNSMVSA